MQRPELFKETRSFKAAIDLMNTLEDAKFPLLLDRIIKQIDGKKTEGFFSAAEEEQLQSLFSLNQQQLEHVVQGCAYVFEQASYFALKPQAFATQIQATSLSEGKAAAFGEVWAAQSEALLTRIRERSFGSPPAVTGISWDLLLPMGSTYTRNDRSLMVRFDLTHTPLPAAPSSAPTPAPSALGTVVPAAAPAPRPVATGCPSLIEASPEQAQADNHVRFELSHEELKTMFQQIEKIQEQLDTLA
ncbi:putative HCaRG protein [Paratrimastix pyriformis]|uniref:HCaRG protein n=1 Tax=Paratrimastix pyriformis TaxID=342808 RepID=A0ABQ8U8F7_9EUKA|nr:putative HCaRG protein [Paratrimastix pyriformis]